jgi:hypothetical protein
VLYILEIFPVLLALISAYTCAGALKRARRGRDKIVYAMGILSTLLLLIGQSTWWYTTLVANTDTIANVRDYVWVAFDIVVTTAFILLTSRRG